MKQVEQASGSAWTVDTLLGPKVTAVNTSKPSTQSRLATTALFVAVTTPVEMPSNPTSPESIGRDLPIVNINSDVTFLEPFADREEWIKSRMVLLVDHNGERIWSCTECDFSHKKTTNVADHIEVKHLVIRVPCHLCPLTFSTSSYLKKHFKHKHPGAIM